MNGFSFIKDGFREKVVWRGITLGHIRYVQNRWEWVELAQRVVSLTHHYRVPNNYGQDKGELAEFMRQNYQPKKV